MREIFRILLGFFKPIILLIAIVILCFLPLDVLPMVSLYEIIPRPDLIVHLVMFFVLVLFLIHPLKTIMLPAYLFALVFSFILGGGIEVFQSYLTKSRTGSWVAMLADLAGTMLGLIIYKYCVSGKNREKYF
jgi:VanZ family protein